MDFTQYQFFDFEPGADLSKIDYFPFGPNMGKKFSECPLMDLIILSHMFPEGLDLLYQYLSSQKCKKFNSMYYPPFIEGFLQEPTFTIQEKMRILEELFQCSFTIKPTTKYACYREVDNKGQGGVWSTSVSTFYSSIPKYKRSFDLQFNKKYPYRYDVTGKSSACVIPVLFIFDNVSWKEQGSVMIGSPIQDGFPVYFGNSERIIVTDFDVCAFDLNSSTESAYGVITKHPNHLKVTIHNFVLPLDA